MCPASICSFLAAGLDEMRGSECRIKAARPGRIDGRGPARCRGAGSLRSSLCCTSASAGGGPGEFRVSDQIVAASRHVPPRTMSAHAIRAGLLATAPAATLHGRRARRAAIHPPVAEPGPIFPSLAIAPRTGNARKFLCPCFEMGPGRSLPPLELGRGVSPSHAAKWRPDPKDRGAATMACSAQAVTGPAPGIAGPGGGPSRLPCNAGQGAGRSS